MKQYVSVFMLTFRNVWKQLLIILAAMAAAEDGLFEFDFLIASPRDEEVDFFRFYSDASFAYDGQRAALTGTAVSTAWWSSAFTVAVYDETGMLYCGEYNTRQNLSESPQGSYSCTPPDSVPAEISWT